MSDRKAERAKMEEALRKEMEEKLKVAPSENPDTKSLLSMSDMVSGVSFPCRPARVRALCTCAERTVAGARECLRVAVICDACSVVTPLTVVAILLRPCVARAQRVFVCVCVCARAHLPTQTRTLAPRMRSSCTPAYGSYTHHTPAHRGS